MGYILRTIPKTEWQTCNAFIFVPDEAVANPGKKYPCHYFFGGAGSAGTSASKLITDAGISKRIAAGWDTATINPVTGITEKSIVIMCQDPTGAPWGDAGTFSFDWLVKGTRLYRGAANIEASPMLPVDLDRVAVTGLSYGGTACILNALWTPQHPARYKAIASIAPNINVNDRNANIPAAVAAGIPVWLYTGANDGFLAYATAFHKAYTAAGGNSLNMTRAGQAHTGSVWESFYAGQVTRPWMVNGVEKQLNYYEWVLAVTTPTNTPPVDPPDELEEYTPTMERGSWVTLRRIGDAAGTTYPGQVLGFEPYTNTYDVFNFETLEIVAAGVQTAVGSQGWYWEAAEPLIK